MKIPSLYLYLSNALNDDASTNDIIQAKQEYKKMYNAQLQKRRRSEMKQLTLTISQELWLSLQKQAEIEEEDVYLYLKTCLQYLGVNESPLLLNKVRLLLAELNEYLLSVMELGLFDATAFQTQLKRIEISIEEYGDHRKQLIY